MHYPEYPLPAANTSRRAFLRRSTSFATALLATSCATMPFKRSPKFSAYPFSLGVASGDPAPDGFVLWTRLAPKPLEGGGMPPEPVEVSWILSEDEAMQHIVRKGREIVSPDWAHSVHVELDGLEPDRWYWYQFKCGTELSPVGRTRTTPAINATTNRFRFAFASCQHFEAGYFDAYRHMVRDDVDLVIHLGDYIYENAGREKQIRKHVGKEIITVDDYRNRHAQYKTDPALQLAHASAPWIVTWDDHEVDNNYAGEISEIIDVPPRQFLHRRAAAYQAYYEHMPLRRYSLPRGPDMQLYRRVSFGNLAEFFVLDTRQYRTDQPCGDRRSPPCPESLSPKATLLGAEQRQWLLNRLGTSPARWKILAQQVMMARVDRAVGEEEEFSMDQWSGYEMERRKILNFVQERNVKNSVVLTGDIHSNWANELALHTDLDCQDPVAAEFVGTSISSGGNGVQAPKHLDSTLAQNPCVKFHNAERGYVRCDITPAQWRTDFRVIESVTVPQSSILNRSSYVLESGSSKLQKS